MSTERAVELQAQAWELQAQGKLDQAFELASEALRLFETSEGALTLDAANLLNDLCEIERDRENFSAALLLSERARGIEEAVADGSQDEDALRIRLKTSSLLGELYRARGEYGRAEAHLLAALGTARELGGTACETAFAQNDLAVLYKYWGRFDDAVELYAQALRAVSAAFGEDSLEAAGILHNLGGVLHARGDFAEAEGPARRAWDISRRHLGDDDSRSLLDASAYAAVLDGLERYSESEAILRHALSIFRAKLGTRHYEVAASLHNLASTVERRGRTEEAERCYREALDIKLELLGDDSPDVAITRNNLGRLLIDSGRSSQAIVLLEAATSTLGRHLPAAHPQRAAAERNLDQARRTR